MNNCCCDIDISVPGISLNLPNGCTVKLGRFDTTLWKLSYGWYSWGGNREVCGWYLADLSDPNKVKPLQKPDLYDIYLIEI